VPLLAGATWGWHKMALMDIQPDRIRIRWATADDGPAPAEGPAAA
jgi:hypothetical protein